ncbi:photosystem II S4 domain protein [Cyanobium sp. Morenito 9A2]|uniref:photosystem II S4 domain protein n=1 Tax=Cyanobium sp. Morenito 9A2 TaxID=2823718 RepID=UPI0020CF6F41|nr:photosystem II S4 domain protein [Cyanobium sp. Morenito 9A2]MCP9849107.1 photosystem II S4 domain protein [Cyanobium sp. Morenito 9A2]
MLPRQNLLEGSRSPAELGALIDLAEQALRTWQPRWSLFVAAAVAEEAIERLGPLSELSLASDGGWPQAERRRLRFNRRQPGGEEAPSDDLVPIAALELAGNFLFDPAEASDFRSALLAAGADAEELGDLWVHGDRGAQLLATPELAERLLEIAAQGPWLVRTVPVQVEPLAIEQLQFPSRRAPKRLNSVEASRRLDAVASAGFGMSRGRMVELIRAGVVRLNWAAVSSPSRELVVGDRIQLENRGELMIEAVEPTKRERWRLVMLRR